MSNKLPKYNIQNSKFTQNTSQSGITIILVLVFAAVFGLSVSALMGFILSQANLGAEKEVREKSFEIAEAGLNYYHWFLTHNPTDLQDGTNSAGPYIHSYNDPETGKKIGSFSLNVVGNVACGQLQSIDVTSTGTVDSDPRFKRTVFGRRAMPSVAEYAYIIGDNVWAGSDRKITGPYHSNGGIRMDGTNNSLVTSSVSNWACDSSFGCSPTQTKNGIFGSGSGNALWKYPTAKVSFTDMATNFSNMKAVAKQSGIYLAPYGYTEIYYYNPYGGPNYTAVDGYHLIFNNDGTVDIYQVTSTSGYWGYRSGIGWSPDFHIIKSEAFIERRTIPSDCSVIFVEDKVWIEGTIKGKVTLVTADLIDSNYKPDVILRNNLNYSTQNGSDGLTVISAFGIYIPPNSPDNLTLNGIFVAQGDRFGRPYYSGNIKTQLTIKGAIVSKERVGTSWSCYGGYFCSGYANRDTSYDRLQTTNPPPFTPASTTTPQYILWREE